MQMKIKYPYFIRVTNLSYPEFTLITRVKNKMKNVLISLFDKALLKKRALIETVNDQLKNISQIEHSRHRCVFNFISNVLCGLIAYCFQPKKSSIR